MAYSVAYQHTDSYRNHDGSNELHGVKERGPTEDLLVPHSIIFVTSILLQEYRSTSWCSWDCGSHA